MVKVRIEILLVILYLIIYQDRCILQIFSTRRCKIKKSLNYLQLNF